MDELPTTINAGRKCINWQKSVGCEVEFEYDDIKGYMKIVEYDKPTREAQISYQNIITPINVSNFKNGHIGNIVGKFTSRYLYDIGDIVDVKVGRIKILKQKRITYGNQSNAKGYKYRCVKCGYSDNITEGHLKEGNSCLVCTNQIVMKGYNDIATTRPDLVSLLYNINDAYTYVSNSTKQVKWICPNCNNIVNKSCHSVAQRGFSCPRCSDGIPYNEKFMYSFLQQISQQFTFQLTKKDFNWCDRYKYDFYTPYIEGIIETHGMQHYEETSGNWDSLKTIRENDNQKQQLAKNNGIKHYIILDCRKSTLEWIKNSIMESELPKLLKFNDKDIDWLKCHEYALSSLNKKTWDLWEHGFDIAKIAKTLKLDYSTIRRYLKKGSNIGRCDYNPNKNKIEYYNKMKNGYMSQYNCKKVICLNTNEIFQSLKDAAQYAGLKSSSHISQVCQGKRKSAGKHPETGEPLHWMYYEDYLKLHNETNDFQKEGVNNND